MPDRTDMNKLLCRLGIHKRVDYNHEGLWKIRKCAECGRVFEFEKLTDKPMIIRTAQCDYPA